jgi:3D (Asp-Asp-Asp) domain-containing protein
LTTRYKGNCIVERRLAKVVNIGLMTMVGVIVNVNSPGLVYSVKAEMNTPHSRRYRTFSSRPIKYRVRLVTAYNVGDPFQTDTTPCIGAGDGNLCRAVARGEKVCAANFVPLNTYLYIRGYGVYRVADRLNSRFKNRVDIAMASHQKDKAREFGVKYLAVSVLNDDQVNPTPFGVDSEDPYGQNYFRVAD